MVECSKCHNPFKPSEQRYDFKQLGFYCLNCMKCSMCGSEARGDRRTIENGVVFCQTCYPKRSITIVKPSIPMNFPWTAPIVLQKDEFIVQYYSNLQEIYDDPRQTLGVRVGNKGYLIITNQNLFFSCKVGLLAKDYSIMWASSLDEIMSVSHGRYGLNDKLILLEKGGQHKDFIARGSQMAIPIINAAITNRRSEIEAQRQRERTIISMDFSWLREYMEKGGLVLNTIKCPTCGAPVKIPEGGGSVKCDHCNSSILVEDVFRKVKELIG
jgi:DNA-directed RNA polymerase subunit RPC12/RpoP